MKNEEFQYGEYYQLSFSSLEPRFSYKATPFKRHSSVAQQTRRCREIRNKSEEIRIGI
jgi:hypothetical protein